MKMNLSAVLIGASLLMGASAQAAVVNVFSNAVVLEDFENLGFVSSGPVVLAGGQVTANSNVLATYDYLPVDLGSNGVWGLDGFVAIGDFYNYTTAPSASDSLTFSFTSGLSAIGAEYSIYKDSATTGQLLLEALDLNGDVLESTTVSFDFQNPLGYNLAEFYGFVRASNDIFGLRVTGDGFVVDNLTTVPVPGALPLLMSALGLVFGLRTRRRASKQK